MSMELQKLKVLCIKYIDGMSILLCRFSNKVFICGVHFAEGQQPENNDFQEREKTYLLSIGILEVTDSYQQHYV